MKPIKVAQIGCGCQHSGKIMKCLLDHPEVFTVVGVADIDGYGSDPDFDGVARLTEEQILAMTDLDAIIVEPEEHLLQDTARRCIDRGFNIHMDKPGGENYERFRELMGLAKQKGLVVHMGYMYRYNPAVRHCVESVRNGQLGRILAIDSAMSTDHPDAMKRWLGTFPGGTMYILGCHMIDLILTLRGAPERIIPYNKKTMQGGIDVYDNNLAILEYPDGVCTVRISSSEVNGYGRRQLVVCGSEGTIEIMPMEHPLRVSVAMKAEAKSPFAETRRPLQFEEGGRYDAMMHAFARMVRGELVNPYTYEHEVALQRATLIACGCDLDLHEEISL